eukprot:998886_1
MDLIEHVLTDIKVNYNLHSRCSQPIDQNDLSLIQSVLAEMNCSFSSNTKRLIEHKYISKMDGNANNLAECIPETPFVRRSKQNHAAKNNLNSQMNMFPDEDAESDESFVFNTTLRDIQTITISHDTSLKRLMNLLLHLHHRKRNSLI